MQIRAPIFLLKLPDRELKMKSKAKSSRYWLEMRVLFFCQPASFISGFISPCFFPPSFFPPSSLLADDCLRWQWLITRSTDATDSSGRKTGSPCLNWQLWNWVLLFSRLHFQVGGLLRSILFPVVLLPIAYRSQRWPINWSADPPFRLRLNPVVELPDVGVYTVN